MAAARRHWGRQAVLLQLRPSSGKGFFPYGRGTVSVVNASTGTLVQQTSVGMGPTLIGRDPASGRLLVLNEYGDGTAPPAPGRSPVCSATTQQNLPDQPSCRQPYTSLSIVTPDL